LKRNKLNFLQEFDYVPRINETSQRKLGLEEMVNGKMNIYENLMKKGEEYKEKSKKS